MKAIIISVLLSLSLAYNAGDAVNYATNWWNGFNPQYNNYDPNDCANFVSQCLKAGGQDLSGCVTDNKGCVTGVSNLQNCLVSKGWKTSSNVPPGFKAGYPVIFPGHATLAYIVNGNDVTLACHSKPHNDGKISWYGTPTYYYL